MAALPQEVREMPRVFLHQGEVLVTRKPVVVQTTLGSCVSVVVHDPVTKLGAMCHAVMPEATSAGDRSLRYVDRAVPHLLARFTRSGIPIERLQVKLIGGSTSSARSGTPRFRPVGPRNVDLALSYIRQYGMDVTAQDTGGERGRRVLFVVPTGDVFVHALKPTEMTYE